MPAAQCSQSKTGNGLSVLHPYKKLCNLSSPRFAGVYWPIIVCTICTCKLDISIRNCL